MEPTPEQIDAMTPIKRHGGNVVVAGWAWRVITVFGFAALVGLGYLNNEKQNTIITEQREHNKRADERLTKLESQWDFVLKAHSAGTVKNAEDIADFKNDYTDMMNAVNGLRGDMQRMTTENGKEFQSIYEKVSSMAQDVAVMKVKVMNGVNP